MSKTCHYIELHHIKKKNNLLVKIIQFDKIVYEKIIINKFKANKSLLRINNKKFICQIGKKVLFLVTERKGDGCTPMGNFKIFKIFYRMIK